MNVIRNNGTHPKATWNRAAWYHEVSIKKQSHSLSLKPLSPSMLRLISHIPIFCGRSFEPIDEILVAAYLVIVQKRSSLLIGRNGGALSSEANFLSEETWNQNDQRGQEEHSHDGECKNPL